MTGSERVLAALHHREGDQVPINDSPWFTAVRRWHQEGLPADMTPQQYFGFEMTGTGADLTLRLPPETVEETDDYTIAWNSNGALRKNWKNATSTPECIDFKVKTAADWYARKREMEFGRDRVNIEGCLHGQKYANDNGLWFSYNAATGYDKTQGIVGSENLLIAMATDPDWVADMFMWHSDGIIATAQMMIDGGVRFDGAFLFDDMGYKNGPLFSLPMYDRMCMAAHKKVCDFFHGYGLKVILHSCGNVTALIPQLLEAGFDCLQPLEVKAGMDLVALKERYGEQLAFMGGIDVRLMADGTDPKLLEDEIRTKVGLAKRGGGYIYHSDHSVPDNVSFDTFKYVMELVHEYGQYD